MATHSSLDAVFAEHCKPVEKVVPRSKDEIDKECLALVENMLRETKARDNKDCVDLRDYCSASGLNFGDATRLLIESGYTVANCMISKKQSSGSVEGEESSLIKAGS